MALLLHVSQTINLSIYLSISVDMSPNLQYVYLIKFYLSIYQFIYLNG